MNLLLAAGLLSLLSALCWTPLMRRVALRADIMDHPDARLKHHTAPTPYLGGVAVFAAFVMTVGMLVDFRAARISGLLLSGSVVLLTGVIDDLRALTPFQKVMGQVLAALILVKSGWSIRSIALPEGFVVPLTVLWLLAMTNAFNVIDVMDGLASGVAAIAAVGLAIANHLAAREPEAVVAIILAGAALGFLRHNAHPARIFLGDAGSLFMGFTLAALAMNAGPGRRDLLAAVSPAFILGVPLFDLALVVVSRWRRGIPVIHGSSDHFALRLQSMDLSVRQSAWTAYAAAGALGIAGLLIGRIRLEGAILIAGAMASLACLAAFLLVKTSLDP